MFQVSFSTLVSVVLVFLFIIFFLLVLRTKPNQNQVKEMKETGWEIVTQIEQYLEKLEEEKQEIEQKIQQFKAIEQSIVQRNENSSPNHNATEEKNEPIVTPSKVSQQKQQIVELHHQGRTPEEIAEALQVQKGIVEVIVNMEKMKKNA